MTSNQRFGLSRIVRAAVLGATCAFAATASPAAPTAAFPAEGCPTKGGTLTVARLADTSGWVYGPENPAIWPRPLVFLSLVINNADGTGLDPQAAESWDKSADFKTFTFHLRDGLKFSDGSPLTAADVVDSWQQLLVDPQVVAANYPKGLAISAPDPKTVVFTMDEPTPSFTELQANLAPIFPKGSDRQVMNSKPISGGPFVMDTWNKGQNFILKRNPYYWDQPYPCLDEIDFNVVGDSNTQALQLQTGQVDIAQEIPANQIQALRSSPGVTVPTFPTWADYLIRLQRKKQPAFQDVKVRQAMNYAIDKQAIIDTVLFGTGQVTDSELPRTLNYVAQEPYTYNVDRAKQLMAQSGYPNGFSTTILTAAGDSAENGIATIVKEELGVIGINVDIKQVEASAKFQLRGNEDYEMFMATTSNDALDDSGFLGVTMTDCCGIDTFWTSYKNQQAEDLYAQLKLEGDTAKRHDIMAQIQKIVWDDAAQLYIAFLDAPVGVRSNVHGLVYPPTRHHYFWTIYKDAS
jgi:peptide/nickel transport system substrate-binding protein